MNLIWKIFCLLITFALVQSSSHARRDNTAVRIYFSTSLYLLLSFTWTRQEGQMGLSVAARHVTFCQVPRWCCLLNDAQCWCCHWHPVDWVTLNWWCFRQAAHSVASSCVCILHPPRVYHRWIYRKMALNCYWSHRNICSWRLCFCRDHVLVQQVLSPFEFQSHSSLLKCSTILSSFVFFSSH